MMAGGPGAKAPNCQGHRCPRAQPPELRAYTPEPRLLGSEPWRPWAKIANSPGRMVARHILPQLYQPLPYLSTKSLYIPSGNVQFKKSTGGLTSSRRPGLDFGLGFWALILALALALALVLTVL